MVTCQLHLISTMDALQKDPSLKRLQMKLAEASWTIRIGEVSNLWSPKSRGKTLMPCLETTQLAPAGHGKARPMIPMKMDSLWSSNMAMEIPFNWRFYIYNGKFSHEWGQNQPSRSLEVVFLRKNRGCPFPGLVTRLPRSSIEKHTQWLRSTIMV